MDESVWKEFILVVDLEYDILAWLACDKEKYPSCRVLTAGLYEFLPQYVGFSVKVGLEITQSVLCPIQSTGMAIYDPGSI